MSASQQLHLALLRYAYIQHMQTSQVAACTGAHKLKQRLARWLCMAHDRHGSDELPLRHEFLSSMLGVRRSGVTLALADLDRRGVVKTHRGSIQIRDRAKLTQSACDCYRSMKLDHERIAAA
jgi:CRP-like cAMP-binding protein